MKILVIGALCCREVDLRRVARFYNIEEDELEFISDYNKIKDIDWGSFKNSATVSDIIFGQIPHCCGPAGHYANVIHKMKSERDFPNIIKAGNGNMRITVSSFKKDLGNTILVKNKK